MSDNVQPKIKYVCEIEIVEGDIRAKLDLMAKAARDESMWKEKHTKQQRFESTNLSGKCGSCRYFRPSCITDMKSYGGCAKGRAWRARTTKACTLYEEKK